MRQNDLEPRQEGGHGEKDEMGSEGKMNGERKCIKEKEIRVGSFSKGQAGCLLWRWMKIEKKDRGREIYTTLKCLA